ncbi:MAG: zinc ABC transporter substrate-binding protein [Planctomycetaceae bacterium]|nr:zinc ABC transporter substrate-binding protein [Planctomycetaceae bacterium]MCB9937576.1 zinc ABC transporter substrate-binding protein [Planctomycetaceae bacterium]
MRVWLSLTLGFFALTGCNGSTPPAGPHNSTNTQAESQPGARTYPYRIVTTCGMVTDIVRQVAGDKATVTGLMGEGVDPHLYKPTRNDVRELMGADVVFYSGLMLEGRMGDNFISLARSGKPVYPITEEIDPDFLREPPEFEGHFDPHVWMDVSAWSECVALIAKVLGEYDTANADFYLTNAISYRDELAKLDEYAKKSIATIPEDRRVLVTAHDAFGYFARAYKIEVRSVQGLSTESEASVQDINNLVNFIVAKKIPAIFVESSVSEKNVRAIIEGAAQQNWEVTIGGELFSDAMGKPGTYEGTYLGMIDHNVTIITRALGGEAPAVGLNGKLHQ